MSTFAYSSHLKLRASFADNDDVAIDPQRVVLTIRTPRDTRVYTFGVDAELVKTAQGKYVLSIHPWWVGPATYVWQSMGAGEEASEAGSFEVVARL